MSREWSEILGWVLGEVNALPYKTSPRWTFYRAYNQYHLSKGDWKRFRTNLAYRRKRFLEGWRPDSLIDSIRHAHFAGHGPKDERAFREQLLKDPPKAGVWNELPFYVECWFEAEAMHGQFEEYLRKPYQITLRPFRGDYTIEPKWKAAKMIQAMAAKKDVIILYFGDADPKGKRILEDALKDIRTWSGNSRFRVVRGGLDETQALRLDLPENPEKPGQYQWDALNDAQAKEIILTTLRDAIGPANLSRLEAAVKRSERRTKRWVKRAQRAFDGGRA